MAQRQTDMIDWLNDIRRDTVCCLCVSRCCACAITIAWIIKHKIKCDFVVVDLRWTNMRTLSLSFDRFWAFDGNEKRNEFFFPFSPTLARLRLDEIHIRKTFYTFDPTDRRTDPKIFSICFLSVRFGSVRFGANWIGGLWIWVEELARIASMIFLSILTQTQPQPHTYAHGRRRD